MQREGAAAGMERCQEAVKKLSALVDIAEMSRISERHRHRRFPPEAYSLAYSIVPSLVGAASLLGVSHTAVGKQLARLGYYDIRADKRSRRYNKALELLAGMENVTKDDLASRLDEICKMQLEKDKEKGIVRGRFRGLPDEAYVIAFLISENFVKMGALLGVTRVNANLRAETLGLLDDERAYLKGLRAGSRDKDPERVTKVFSEMREELMFLVTRARRR